MQSEPRQDRNWFESQTAWRLLLCNALYLERVAVQFDHTSIELFLTVCPSCRREGKARPPTDGWSRHYLCADCGAAWVLLTLPVSLRQANPAGSSTGVYDSAADTVVIVGLA
jgi:hypothetical protein